MDVRLVFCVLLFSFAAGTLVVAAAASGPDSSIDDNSRRLYGALWAEQGTLDYAEVARMLKEFMETTRGTNDQRLLEARKVGERLENLHNFSFHERWPKCETTTTPFDSINLADYPPNLATYIESERSWLIIWCRQTVRREIEWAIGRFPEADALNLDQLMGNEIGVDTQNGTLSVTTDDDIARGIAAYLVAREPDLSATVSGGGEVSGEFVSAYSRHIVSLCGLLVWTFAPITQRHVYWIVNHHSFNVGAWKMWLKRRDVCETIISRREVFIPASFAHLPEH